MQISKENKTIDCLSILDVLAMALMQGTTGDLIIVDGVRGRLSSIRPLSKSAVTRKVPSAVVMADVFAAEVDFFAIGTNNLIQ